MTPKCRKTSTPVRPSMAQCLGSSALFSLANLAQRLQDAVTRHEDRVEVKVEAENMNGS